MYEHIFYERRLDHVSILLRSGCAVAYMHTWLSTRSEGHSNGWAKGWKARSARAQKGAFN